MKDLFEYVENINSLYNVYINESKEQYEKYITTSGIHLGAGGKCGWFATAEECLKFFLIEKNNKNKWEFIKTNNNVTDEQIFGLKFRNVIFKKTAKPDEIANFIIEIYNNNNFKKIINNDNINGKNAPLIFSSKLESYLLSTRPMYVGIFDNIIDNYKNIINNKKIDKLKEGHTGFGGKKTENGLEYENIIKSDIKNNIIKQIIPSINIEINKNLLSIINTECVKNIIKKYKQTKLQYIDLFNELDNYIYLTGNESASRLSSGIINQETCKFNKETMLLNMNNSIINIADIIIVSNENIINNLKLSNDGKIKRIIKSDINYKNNTDYVLISIKLKDHQNSTMSFAYQFKNLITYKNDIQKRNIFMQNFCNLFCICDNIKNNIDIVNNINSVITTDIPDKNKNKNIIYNTTDIKQGNVNYTNLSLIINFLYGYNYWFVKQNSPAIIKNPIDLSSLKFEAIKLANHDKSSLHIFYSYININDEKKYLSLDFRTSNTMQIIPCRLFIKSVKNIPIK